MSHVDEETRAELPLQVGGSGEAELLLLISRPRDGRVVVRRWSSDDWSAPATSRTEDAAELLQWVNAQAERGRTLNQSLYAVRMWLRDEGVAPRTR